MHSGPVGNSNSTLLAALIAFLMGFSAASGASALAAEPPPLLWGKEPPVCTAGSGSGQCALPRGVAADPRNGHIFVNDTVNQRVNEFNALGQFVKVWGRDVVQSGPDDNGTGFEVCVPHKGDLCKVGSAGSGAGEFSEIAAGIAVDSAGDVYVTDRGFLATPSVRVEKFDPQGHFVLMFGGEVNKTKVEGGGASEEEENLCPFDPGDECKVGTIGAGNGQFGEWAVGDFIAIDRRGTSTPSDDRVYVGDRNRIQRFDVQGHYLESIPIPAGETVQSLDVDSAGSLYVIYDGRNDIHKLTSAGEELQTFAIAAPTAVGADSEGNVFAFAGGAIHEFGPSGNPIVSFGNGEFAASTGLATNLCAGSAAPGNLYVTNLSMASPFLRAYGTVPFGCFKARTVAADTIEEEAARLNGSVNPTGLPVTECFFEFGATIAYGQVAQCEAPSVGEIGTGTTPVPVHAAIGGLQKGTIYHFRLVAKIGGETEAGADEELKTLGPPVISNERAVSVSESEATLKTLVNPEGFATSYHFEYTTQANFEAHGFEGAQSTSAIGAGKDRTDHSVSVSLGGLTPGTAYLWRVLAINASGASVGGAQTFVTYRTFVPEACANQEFRTGASSFLPDCRAYEMVSPVDKNGGDIVNAVTFVADPAGYVQAAADGDSIAYGAYVASFAGEPSSFLVNQYMAHRGERGGPGEGWSSEGIHPVVEGRGLERSFGLSRDFIAFSADLCNAWPIDRQTPPPTLDGQDGFLNLYRRRNCGPEAGSLEALIPNPPYTLPAGTSAVFVNNLAVQGTSADSRHVLFVAQTNLIPEASSALQDERKILQTYDRFGGELHLVSVLPNSGGKGKANPTDSGVGGDFFGTGYAEHAVSEDGSRVYWSAGLDNLGTGTIYLREHPEQGIVEEECADSTAACTLPVSLPPERAFFWTAATDGSKALYSQGENLWEYDLVKKEEGKTPRRLIAGEVLGVAGASDDLSHIYFASKEVLAGSGENSAGDEAEAGQVNLYLDEGGKQRFIGTLLSVDMINTGGEAPAYSLAAALTYWQATRVSPDGTRIAFESRAALTGFDNSDAETGRADLEVFSYKANGGSGLLTCISCNPSGARPAGAPELRIPYQSALLESTSATKVPAAAWIPTWEHPLHASNVLSSDGTRIFFNSSEPLIPRDINGTQDVYEWEEPGVGRCGLESPSYFPQNDGCISLISNGESPFESEFWEASPDGRDVFFTTASSLLPQDPGSVDLYDARVEGGFRQPPPQAECEGGACQSPRPPPAFQTPSSSSYSGPGNAAHRPPCRKHTAHKGKKAHCATGKHKSRRHRRGKGRGSR